MSDISENLKLQTIIETLTEPLETLLYVMKKADLTMIGYMHIFPYYNDGDLCTPYAQIYIPHTYSDWGYCYITEDGDIDFIEYLKDLEEIDPKLIPASQIGDLKELLKNEDYKGLYDRFRVALSDEIETAIYKLVELATECNTKGTISTERPFESTLQFEEFYPD
jgi:hypothetical protein